MVLSLQFVKIHFTFNDNNSIKGKTKKKKKRSLYMVRLCAARCLCQLFDICFAPQKLALRGKCAVNVQAIETIIKKKKERNEEHLVFIADIGNKIQKHAQFSRYLHLRNGKHNEGKLSVVQRRGGCALRTSKRATAVTQG